MDLSKQMTDDWIVNALKQTGVVETDAIRHLYQAHYNPLCQFIIQNSGSEQDADDIFQETVITFIHTVKQGKFRGEASIGTFLFALNRNIWRNEMKKRGRSQVRETKFEQLSAHVETDAQSALEQQQSSHQLLKLMDMIGENCKKILLQFYYEDKPMKEIVSTLNYENEQVVRNKKSKCLKKLAEMMNSNPQLHQQFKTLLHE
jgi:RNA polymerase sigma factor (sigma-70 family)